MSACLCSVRHYSWVSPGGSVGCTLAEQCLRVQGRSYYGNPVCKCCRAAAGSAECLEGGAYPCHWKSLKRQEERLDQLPSPSVCKRVCKHTHCRRRNGVAGHGAFTHADIRFRHGNCNLFTKILSFDIFSRLWAFISPATDIHRGVQILKHTFKKPCVSIIESVRAQIYVQTNDSPIHLF